MTPYVAVGAGDVRVTVWRGEPKDLWVPYELRVGDRAIGRVHGHEAYMPHVAVFDRHVALWAGPPVLVADVRSGVSGTYEDAMGDTVAVLPLGDRWLVVSELAVSLRSADLATEHAYFHYGEVFLDASLRGDALVLTDFDGVEVVLDAATLEPSA